MREARFVTLGERQMRVYPPIVEQLSQLFLNNWDNCSTLVYSYLPVALKLTTNHGSSLRDVNLPNSQCSDLRFVESV